jgi:hypothetical protein
MMGHGDVVGAKTRARRFQKAIPKLAGSLLQRLAMPGGMCRHVSALYNERHVQTGAKLGYKARIPVGALPPYAMIIMRRIYGQSKLY